MPELPEIELYRHALIPRLVGAPLAALRIESPFLLRTVEPRPGELCGRPVVEIRRLGKRLVLGFTGDLFAVLHLMVAGRLRWRPAGAPIPQRRGLAAFDFPAGSLVVSEAGTRKRASLHLLRGKERLAEHDPGGLEVMTAEAADFAAALRRENHTLKRALTDPRILAGIGNAYSDEILHRARMSPFRRTAELSAADCALLLASAREVLGEWRQRLVAEAGDGFPASLTSRRPEMAVHGRYRLPCPRCGSPVQRIVYAQSEANYCPVCQTGGRLLADRALSRLLKQDWPRRIEELETLYRR